ncbi:hypothetical protein [Nonomuraea sp. SYSU D8015]|uniref:hypothetical protein n=1 Tax=Nonomuraea sp. SYSU D8015 TaxID=2593644 RepID=UPI001660D369|nr:hypothetical protein [Nonomuraea sp. SYSU D8015]
MTGLYDDGARYGPAAGLDDHAGPDIEEPDIGGIYDDGACYGQLAARRPGEDEA